MDTKNLIPLLAMPFLLLAVEIGAILLSLPVQATGIVAFEDPSSVANPIWFIAILLVFTAILLVLIKYDMKKVIAAVIGISIFLTFVYIFMALVFDVMGPTDPATVVVLVISVLATVLLYKYPEWYVIDALGVLIGAGVAAIFGASLDVIPVLILLDPPRDLRCDLRVQDQAHDHARGRRDRPEDPDSLRHPEAEGLLVHQRGHREDWRRRGTGCVHHRHGRHDHARDPCGVGERLYQRLETVAA